MSNRIIVTVISSDDIPDSPTYCAIVITNCDAMHVDAKRQQINGRASAHFMNVPPGRYYVVVIPEGENARYTRFIMIDEEAKETSLTFDLATIPPSGRITAIVLVGGQRSPGDTVMIRGKADGHTEYCMTDYKGHAEFPAVPETQAYEVIAYHASANQGDTCDLVTDGDCAKQFSF